MKIKENVMYLIKIIWYIYHIVYIQYGTLYIIYLTSYKCLQILEFKLTDCIFGVMLTLLRLNSISTSSVSVPFT